MIGRRTLIQAGAIGMAAPALALGRPAGGIVLLDRRIPDRDLAQIPMLVGATTMPLAPEIVRQWRQELRAIFLGGSRGLAIVRWDKALLLVGLAREDGLAVRQRRIGGSLFAIDIG